MGFFFKSKEDREEAKKRIREDYDKKMQAIDKEFEDKKAEINQRFDDRVDDRLSEIKNKKASFDNKINLKLQKLSNAMIEKSIKLSEYGLSLLHHSGLDCVGISEKVKVEANSRKQQLEIEYLNKIYLLIPYTNVISSKITNDVEIPEGDFENNYNFYITIKYHQNNQEKELVLFSFQNKQSKTHDIRGLDYILNHLDVKMKEYEDRTNDINEWNAKFDARDAKLREQREQLLNKRSEQIDQLKGLFHNNSNQQSETFIHTQPQAPSYDISAELRKFKSLLDDGVISQEEFDAKKKQLLAL
jgi:hypothetical protein